MAKAELKAVISADARAFYRTVGMLGRNVKTAFATMGTASGAIVGMWAMAVRSLVEYGSAVNDLSERTGLGTTLLQELGYTASMVGASMDDLEPAVKAVANLLEQAGTKGGNNARAAFQKLGLSWQTLAASSPDQQLTTVLDAIGRIENPTQRAALAVDVFGKAGMRLIPVATSFREMGAEARAMGILLSPEQIKSADDLGDAFTKMGARIKGTAFAAVAPDIARMAAGLNEMARNPQLWAALEPALRTVSQAIVDLGVNLKDLVTDAETLRMLKDTAQAVADSFKLAADAAAMIAPVIKPLMAYMEFQRGWMTEVANVPTGLATGATVKGEYLTALGKYTPDQQTAAAVALRDRGITMNRYGAEGYFPAMLAELQRLNQNVAPLTTEQ